MNDPTPCGPELRFTLRQDFDAASAALPAIDRQSFRGDIEAAVESGVDDSYTRDLGLDAAGPSLAGPTFPGRA